MPYSLVTCSSGKGTGKANVARLDCFAFVVFTFASDFRLIAMVINRRKGLECRRQFCEPVGAWFSQLGSLNYVHHMWTYPYVYFPPILLTVRFELSPACGCKYGFRDLQTRKETRESAWKIEGWPQTVYNTGS